MKRHARHQLRPSLKKTEHLSESNMRRAHNILSSLALSVVFLTRNLRASCFQKSKYARPSPGLATRFCPSYVSSPEEAVLASRAVELSKSQDVRPTVQDEASSNKCHASSNRCLTSSNKKLLELIKQINSNSFLLLLVRQKLILIAFCYY